MVGMGADAGKWVEGGFLCGEVTNSIMNNGHIGAPVNIMTGKQTGLKALSSRNFDGGR